MAEQRTIHVALSSDEVGLLIEALDSHEYWQLSDPSWRDSGYVILPGESLPVGPSAQPLDAEQRQAIAEIEATRRLADRLRVESTRKQRPRCELCGEPVELADPSDPESWVHTEDANDLADHTAELNLLQGPDASQT